MFMKLFRKPVLLLGVIALAMTANSQTPLDTARNIALEFFKTYDSLHYLTFDVKFIYSSDTVYGDYSHEVMTGTYTMSGSKAKYNIGDVEYLQNDSFNIAVYHKDEMIVVADPVVRNAGSLLPMRDMIDSLLQSYAPHYTISVKAASTGVDDSLGYVKLLKKTTDTLSYYNKYVIEFNLEYFTITAIDIEFTEPGHNLSIEDEPDEAVRLLKNSSRTRRLRIEFSNYRLENFSDDVYSENNFIWEEDGEYKPVGKFKTYTVYNARK
jgi:hypothetical protein